MSHKLYRFVVQPSPPSVSRTIACQTNSEPQETLTTVFPSPSAPFRLCGPDCPRTLPSKKSPEPSRRQTSFVEHTVFQAQRAGAHQTSLSPQPSGPRARTRCLSPLHGALAGFRLLPTVGHAAVNTGARVSVGVPALYFSLLREK